MLNLKKIGKKITELRKEKNMKQNELAEALYVTHQAVSKWENGKSIPSIEILYELTKLFKVSIDFLLDNSDIKTDDYETLFNNYPRRSVF
ncbi:MAG: helix-turn-helix transcriptional regulator, partial [Tenericutes bacterium]|nr:helix-turn-helix transcriptional regulator [Mycoplasmatota bacterium]